MSSALAVRLAERLIEELDPVTAYIECMTEDVAGARMPSSKLYQTYTMWCTVWGIKPLLIHEFNNELVRKGYRRVHPGNRKYWCGLAFASPNYYANTVEDEEDV